MDAYNGLNNATNIFTPDIVDDFKERIAYDANGNIKSYLRNGSGSSLNLNNYGYTYTLGTNRLQSRTNTVNQEIKNYGYDEIGNTVTDEKQGVTNGVWNVYGKLQSLTNKDGIDIKYTYDAAGQRISKKVGDIEEWYIKDASGNTMATYKKDASINNGHLSATEFYKYGSSLLSIKSTAIDLQILHVNDKIQTYLAGNDGYILTDQSGNTRIIVSDKKIQHSSNGITVDYYTADVKNANYYSTYGAISKTFGVTPVLGFNGQRKSTEISTDAQTAEFWEYNGDVGRRWNVEARPTVGISPFSTFKNNPVFYSDPFGDTTVTGAGGKQSVEINEKSNSLEFYDAGKYTISGSKTQVPVQQGQLRSFSNALGKFKARWKTDDNGNVVFDGYKNERNQTTNAAIQELREWSTGLKGYLIRAFMWGDEQYKESQRDPLGYNLKFSATLLTISAMGAVEPVVYNPGYNPSVTFSQGAADFGFAYRAINPKYLQSTLQNGFYISGTPGRLGNDGVYLNNTIQGVLKEFRFHNPGINPVIFEVRYPISRPLLINPPSGYFPHPLPFTKDANILSAPSLRAPGTTNLLIREGAEIEKRIK